MIVRPTSTICTLLLLAAACSGQQPKRHEPPSALVVGPAAFNVTFDYTGLPMAEGCDRLKYDVSEPYPGVATIRFITAELSRQGWTRQTRSSLQPVYLMGSGEKLGVWRRWENVGGSMTSSRADQWTNAAGSLASYKFWYLANTKKLMRVEAVYCSTTLIAKRRCESNVPIPHDERAYSLALKILNVEQAQKDFKVSVELINNGTRPVQIGLNGLLEDGLPNLQGLSIEQQEANGEWASVGGICYEIGPPDWITLQPAEKLENWAMAVDFPEVNHGFGMCRRKIGHLKGSVRASIRYYVDACEIRDPLSNRTPYVAKSEPVALPKSDTANQ